MGASFCLAGGELENGKNSRLEAAPTLALPWPLLRSRAHGALLRGNATRKPSEGWLLCMCSSECVDITQRLDQTTCALVGFVLRRAIAVTFGRTLRA